MDFAYALSRYSAGISEELQRGPANSNSVDFFLEASLHDPSNYLLARKAAIGLLYRRRGHEAAELLENTSVLNPTNYSLLLDLATVYDISEQPEKQFQTYERAMKLSPTNSAAYIASARSYLALGRFPEALRSLTKGARQADRKLMSDLALINAAALLKGGFPGKSIEWFNFVAENADDSRARIRLVIAEIHEGRGETAKALEQYEKAIQENSATPDAYVKMAILINEQDQQAAMKVLDQAERRFPMDDLIISAVTYLSDKNKDRAAAVDLLTKFANRSAKQPTEAFFLSLGASYERQGEIEKAAGVFEKGIAAYPDSHSMLNYLAYMWAEKGLNLQRGEEMTKRALKFEPESGAYLDTLAWIYFMQGNNRDALVYIRKAIKHLPEDPTILDHYGDILAKNGKIGDALKQWQRSYEIDPSNDNLKTKLAEHNALPAPNTDE